MMQISGIKSDAPVMNGVTAYVPALLAASIVVHYLLKYHFTFFKNIFGLLAPIFIYSHIMVVYGNLSQWKGYENYFSVGILRGIAGVTLGAECYILSKEWQKSRSNVVKGILILFIIFMVGALVFARDNISFSDEVIYPYVFALLLAIVYEGGREWCFLEKPLNYLGKISYGIFLMHYGVCKLLVYYFPGYGYIQMMIVCVFISSMLGILLTKLSQMIIKRI